MGRCSSGKFSVHVATEHPGFHYLLRQTGLSTVLANDNQNSGLVNFVLESCLPFVQIRSIYQKRRETGIKDGWEEMEYKFLFGRFFAEKQDYLFRCSVAPGNFPRERPKKSCSLYFPTKFSENVL